MLERGAARSAWYETDAIEQLCYALLETLIAGTEVPTGTVVTSVVAVYEDGEALVKVVVMVEREGERSVGLFWTWLNLRRQGVVYIGKEVEKISMAVRGKR